MAGSVTSGGSGLFKDVAMFACRGGINESVGDVGVRVWTGCVYIAKAPDPRHIPGCNLHRMLVTDVGFRGNGRVLGGVVGGGVEKKREKSVEGI